MTPFYAVNLYNSVKRGGGFIADITARAFNWRRTVRRIGGFWQASFEYKGNRDDLDDLFFDGLMKEVREYSGGVQAWQGFIGDMLYKRGPVTWSRSIFDVNNSIKCQYTRQFPNLLTNGSAESGAWAVYAGATVTQSNVWSSDSVYSCKIVATGAAIMGATIQTGIALTSETGYNLQITLNIVSGTWRVYVYPDGDPANKIVGKRSSVAGVQRFELQIPATHTFSGNVTIGVRNGSEGGDGIPYAGTVYCDAAIFSQQPAAADTGWVTDAASITEYGRLEKILLEGAMTAEAASAKVTTLLTREAWPRLLAPDEFGGVVDDTDSLTVSCYGYIFTLPWAINTVVAESTASATVTALMAGRDYVASSAISPNTLIFTPDNRYQISVWQVLKTIVTSGDASGNLWALGMYADRQLRYEQFSSTIAYRYRDGRLYNPAGGEMESWLTLPGWASLDDAPLVPYMTPAGFDDPRRIIVEEVEFLAPDLLRFRSKVSE